MAATQAQLINLARLAMCSGVYGRAVALQERLDRWQVVADSHPDDPFPEKHCAFLRGQRHAYACELMELCGTGDFLSWKASITAKQPWNSSWVKKVSDDNVSLSELTELLKPIGWGALIEP